MKEASALKASVSSTSLLECDRRLISLDLVIYKDYQFENETSQNTI